MWPNFITITYGILMTIFFRQVPRCWYLRYAYSPASGTTTIHTDTIRITFCRTRVTLVIRMRSYRSAPGTGIASGRGMRCCRWKPWYPRWSAETCSVRQTGVRRRKTCGWCFWLRWSSSTIVTWKSNRETTWWESHAVIPKTDVTCQFEQTQAIVKLFIIVF